MTGSPSRSRSRFSFRVRDLRRPALSLILLCAGATVWALSGTPFEGTDGNLETGAGTDWQDFVGDTRLSVGQDLPSGQNDDSLKGKVNDPVPGVDVGSIPKNKSDLLRFYVVHETRTAPDTTDHDFLYVAWVRDNILGTANMDFEFSQSAVISSNGGTPVRTIGDMLITFAFANGGNTVNLGLSRWVDSGSCEESGANPPCWSPIQLLSGAGIAEGSVNAIPTFDPIEGVTLPELTFGEAVINLTEAGVFDSTGCVTFGNAHVKSRSSDSFTAAMKDFIRPIDVSVSNCATIKVTKDAIPDDAQDFTFVPSPELGSGPFQLDDDGDHDNELPPQSLVHRPLRGDADRHRAAAERLGSDERGVHRRRYAR